MNEDKQLLIEMGNRISKRRKELQLTQEQLAEAMVGILGFLIDIYIKEFFQFLSSDIFKCCSCKRGKQDVI